MTGSDNQCEKLTDGLIELEPAASTAGAISEAGPATVLPEKEPIPQRPLHLCPTCDYNLTGLISRRCPECGEPFTIPDARQRGFELSEGGRELRRWLRADRAILVLGVFLLVFGIICPCIYRDPLAGTLQFAPTLRTWAIWLGLVPLSGVMLMVNVYCEQSWSHALLEIGVVATIVGIIAVLL